MKINQSDVSGRNHPWLNYSPPLAASFPTVGGTVTPTVTDSTNDRGLIVNFGNSATGSVGRYAVNNLTSLGVTTPTNPWYLTTRTRFFPTDDEAQIGYCFRKSDNSYTIVTKNGGGKISLINMNSGNTWASNIDTGTFWAIENDVWLRFVFDGTNLNIKASADGYEFFGDWSFASTTITQVGFGCFMNVSKTYPSKLNCLYWNLQEGSPS